MAAPDLRRIVVRQFVALHRILFPADARLGALLAFLRTRGWLILLRRDAPAPRPHKEVVITVGRARRVFMNRAGSPPG